MKALITGISGMDGSYLSDLLLEKGMEVHGIVRRHSVAENQTTRINHLRDMVTLHYGDLSDFSSLWNILEKVKPDYVFNLGAISQVKISFDVPQYTLDVNATAVQVLLEGCRKHCPHVKFYQASSSEMFGINIDDDNFQRESTPFNPASPYAISKVSAYNFVRHYRRAYGMHACNGILFNHESPRRGSNFVTQKVAKGAAEIKLGLRDKLELGNLDAYRDWGHAYDYVRAQLLIVDHIKPMDWVVATGEAHSVRDMVSFVFEYLGMDYQNHIVINPMYFRAEEVPYLRGDSTKIRTILGWESKYTFESMMKEMVDYWMVELSK